MAEESLRDDELGAGEHAAFAKTVAPPPYEPDLVAYDVDPANDPYRRFTEAIEAGATIELSLPTIDGRREYLELDRTESQAWIRAPLRERMVFANGKIRERRATVAITAAKRLTGKAVIEHKDLRPEEEAFMREFRLLEDVRIPLAEGGYDKGMRLREATVAGALSNLREDSFWDGGFDDASAYGYDAPTEREYLPRGGPMGQQQTISDIWDALAKSYYAFTHDPAIRFALELLSDFVLGRSFSIIAKDEKVQKVIDEFVSRELRPQSQQTATPWGPGRISNRLHDMATSLWCDGDLFIRKFPLGDGRLKVRTLPAETIWETITDSEDPLEVYYYVQRYQTRVMLFAPTNIPASHTRYVERWITRDEMVHTIINAKESDARGRGDPFASLGWAKRLRDYFDAVIQKQYAGAAYQWWLKVSGGPGDVQRIGGTAIPSSKPAPGSFMLTNDQVEVNSLASGVAGSVSGDGTAYDALINHIALAFGLNKSYFGVDSHANRATALVATEPTAKHLETRQDLIIDFLTKLLGDVIAEATKYGLIPAKADLSFKVRLPSIIKADASTRGEMMRKGEGMGYWSKRTAAEEYAAEAEVDDYDYDDEQKKIKAEIDQDGNKLIMKDVEMVTKGQPEPADVAFPPGDVPNPDYQNPGNGKPTNGVVPAKVPDPHDASPTSATGAAAIRKDLGRGSPGDRSTMESDDAFREECKRRGAVVIYPD
ncbi:MAG TPA: hypothetical protein VHR97_01640 [Candidatus Baltobacteraceae bacterium]|jgi:hypothetical protein|nr:hypothetical protein [Candidatus Baltobacteraceae bacterium]